MEFDTIDFQYNYFHFLFRQLRDITVFTEHPNIHGGPKK